MASRRLSNATPADRSGKNLAKKPCAFVSSLHLLKYYISVVTSLQLLSILLIFASHLSRRSTSAIDLSPRAHPYAGVLRHTSDTQRRTSDQYRLLKAAQSSEGSSPYTNQQFHRSFTIWPGYSRALTILSLRSTSGG